MKISFLIFLFIVFLSSLQNSFAGDSEPRLERIQTFQLNDKDYEIEYSKVEASGCTTVLGLNQYHPYFDIEHGSHCDVDLEKRESIHEIAASVSEIINYFGLANEIIDMNSVYIFIGWKTNYEPLIRFINDDESWPANIHAFIKERYTSEHDRYVALRERLRKEIEKSKIYDPIVKSMSEIGCEMTLAEHFAEGLFIDEHKITKNMLIEWGVFREAEANKDEYPVLKGGLAYKLECKKNGTGGK